MGGCLWPCQLPRPCVCPETVGKPIPARTKAIRHTPRSPHDGASESIAASGSCSAKQSCAGWRPARMYTSTRSKETQSSVITCPVCGSDTVKRTGRFGSFWGCSRYPDCRGTQPFKIDYAGQPCRHCRTPVVRQTHAKPPKPRPEEATSLGGSSALAARRSTWWKQPDGSLMVPARLSHRQRRKLRPNGSPANVPSCPGTSGQLRSLTSFADPPSALAEVTRVCFPKLTQAVL